MKSIESRVERLEQSNPPRAEGALFNADHIIAFLQGRKEAVPSREWAEIEAAYAAIGVEAGGTP